MKPKWSKQEAVSSLNFTLRIWINISTYYALDWINISIIILDAEINYFYCYHSFDPQKIEALELKDYRVISLIGGVYKITAMLLEKRLKKVVRNLVNKNQMAFIIGGTNHGCCINS